MSDRRMDVVKRDDTDFEITFTDVDGNIVDLTDCTVFFTVKENKHDTDDQALIKKKITAFAVPTSGVALLQLTATDTNIPAKGYFFDIQLKNKAGKISSTISGRFIVSQDITIRIS